MLFGISTNLGQNIRSVDKLPLHCGCHVGTPPSLYAKLNKVRWNTSPNNGIAFGQTKNLADLNLGKVYISIIYPILVSGLYLLNGWNLCICCIQAVWNLLQLILKLFVLLGISTNLGQNTGSVDKLLLHCSCHVGTPPKGTWCLHAKPNRVGWNTSPNNGIAFGQMKNHADLNLGEVYISITYMYHILVSGL